MKIRKVTAISVQTDEAFVVRRITSSSPVCTHKGKPDNMVSPDEAAVLFHLPVRVIYRLIEAGQLHFEETPAGSVSVCLESLGSAIPQLPGKPWPQIKNKKEM